MPELEDRIRTWTDQVTDGVDPVTLDEVLQRAGTIDLVEGARSGPPRTLAIAAVVVLVGAVAGLLLLLTVIDDDQPVVTESMHNPDLDIIARLLPDGGGGGEWITIDDNEVLLEQLGVQRPAPDSSVEDTAAFLDELMMDHGSMIGVPRETLRSMHVGTAEWTQAFRDELGIDPAQVRAFAEWGERPDLVWVMIGDFDPDLAHRSLTTNVWADDLVEHEHRGVRYYSWFDDFEVDVPRATTLNSLGQARRIALVDQTLIVTRSTATMEATIDRYLDPDTVATDQLRAILSTLSAGRWSNQLWPTRGLDNGSYLTLGAIGERAQRLSDVSAFSIAPAPSSSVEALLDEVTAVVDRTLADAPYDKVSITEEAGVVTITIEAGASADAPFLDTGEHPTWPPFRDLILALASPPEALE